MIEVNFDWNKENMLARSLVKDVKREEGSPVVILKLERERERHLQQILNRCHMFRDGSTCSFLHSPSRDCSKTGTVHQSDVNINFLSFILLSQANYSYHTTHFKRQNISYWCYILFSLRRVWQWCFILKTRCLLHASLISNDSSYDLFLKSTSVI